MPAWRPTPERLRDPPSSYPAMRLSAFAFDEAVCRASRREPRERPPDYRSLSLVEPAGIARIPASDGEGGANHNAHGETP